MYIDRHDSRTVTDLNEGQAFGAGGWANERASGRAGGYVGGFVRRYYLHYEGVCSKRLKEC